MVWLLVLPVVILFGVIGLVGLFQPEQIGGVSSVDVVGAEARAEVRSAYGGRNWGLAVAAVLSANAASGYALAMLGVIVAGAALGRLLSLSLDRVISWIPTWALFMIEAVAGGLLFGAAAVV
ncbi:MAG: hypothetical protein ACI8Y4_004641 [Candidatus Poriferisodalaceae bacterium]|jgi:hypothetical protein